jgi:hypothetical protein
MMIWRGWMIRVRELESFARFARRVGNNVKNRIAIFVKIICRALRDTIFLTL